MARPVNSFCYLQLQDLSIESGPRFVACEDECSLSTPCSNGHSHCHCSQIHGNSQRNPAGGMPETMPERAGSLWTPEWELSLDLELLLGCWDQEKILLEVTLKNMLTPQSLMSEKQFFEFYLSAYLLFIFPFWYFFVFYPSFGVLAPCSLRLALYLAEVISSVYSSECILCHLSGLKVIQA